MFLILIIRSNWSICWAEEVSSCSSSVFQFPHFKQIFPFPQFKQISNLILGPNYSWHDYSPFPQMCPQVFLKRVLKYFLCFFLLFLICTEPVKNLLFHNLSSLLGYLLAVNWFDLYDRKGEKCDMYWKLLQKKYFFCIQPF